MDFQLKGKSALVTGSSTGIGFFIAKELASQGCLVGLNARNRDILDKACSELPGTIGCPGDVSNLSQAVDVVNEFVNCAGKLDILVCNVGSGKSVPAGFECYEDWQTSFTMNLWSTTNTVEAARSFVEESQGSIVCISSICGLETIPGAPATYSAAKAALNSYVKCVSRPFGQKGVRINAVAPGNILFQGSTWENKLNTSESSVIQYIEQEVPLNRLGSANEIAVLVAYLASPLSKFVTGQIWAIDGGQVRS